MPERRSKANAPSGELGEQDGSKGKGGGRLPLCQQGEAHLGQVINQQRHISIQESGDSFSNRAMCMSIVI